MIISIIAAIGENRELGRNNNLIWKIPEDMKRFRESTSGHPVIMGRKTYESIGRPLPHRTNIIITRQSGYQADGCLVVDSIEQAITQAKKLATEEIFIIGGGEIYKAAWPHVNRLYLTIVHKTAAADVFFPEYAEFTKVINKEERDNGEYRFTFLDLEK